MSMTNDYIRELDEAALIDQIVEETGEVLQAIMKLRRFQPEGSHPDRPDSSNILELAKEGEFLGALIRIYAARYEISYGQTCDDRAKKSEFRVAS